MEFLLGATFSFSDSSPTAHDRDEQENLRSRSEIEIEIAESKKSPTVSSESSSSIGTPEEDIESDEEDDVVSSKSRFDSLGSLDDALPNKRGLSNHFSGKSKSFGNLSEVITVNDLKKTENPINKKRRVLIACKLSRKASFYNWANNPKSMPLLKLDEEEEESESSFDSFEEKQEKGNQKMRNLKAHSCFSLADLQEHHHHH